MMSRWDTRALSPHREGEALSVRSVSERETLVRRGEGMCGERGAHVLLRGGLAAAVSKCRVNINGEKSLCATLLAAAPPRAHFIACLPLLPKCSWSVRAALGGMSSVHRLHCCCCTRGGAGGCAHGVGWQHRGAGGAVSAATRRCSTIVYDVRVEQVWRRRRGVGEPRGAKEVSMCVRKTIDAVTLGLSHGEAASSYLPCCCCSMARTREV